MRWAPASEGMVVPSTAMSEREPPWGFGSEDIFVIWSRGIVFEICTLLYF